jgi:WD40 repeat protein
MPAKRPAAASLASLAILLAGGAARADEPKKINYKDNVSAIFQARCNACHNNDKKKGGLVLDNFASLMQGGGSGAVVEPGDPDNSRLYLLVAHEEEPTMPPNSPKIPDAEIATIKDWIAAGAPETSGSVVAMKEKPKLEFKIDPAAVGKPQGEPAMPRGISTEPVVVSGRPPAILAMAASPWAPLVAIAGHHQVVLYDTQTFRLVGVLPFPEGIVASLKFTTDGELLLAGGGRGGQSGRVVVWDVKTGERLFEVGKEYDTVLAADISPDRSLVALGGPSKMLRVYNTSDGELVYECKKHTEWVTAVAFSPDGVLLASGDRNGGLVAWEAQTGREFYDLRGHQAMITDVSWRLDSNVLASSSEDGGIRLWEMQNGNNIKTWAAHGGGALSVRFAKDGRLVSAGRDRVAKLWDQNGGQQRQFDGFGDVALQAVFTHDESAIVAGDFAGEVRVYELKEGKRVADLVANPEPVAARLGKVDQALAQARAEAENAAKELAALRAGVASRGEASAKAEAALAEATAADDAARAAIDAGDAALRQGQAKLAEASKAYSAADFARSQAAALRDAALQELRETEAAAREAQAAAERSGMPRDRQVADSAASALAEVSARIEANLPVWSSALVAWGPARQAYDQAEAERVAVEVRLPMLRRSAALAAAAVPPAREALADAQAAKAEAEKAIAEKAPAVQALVAKADALQAERDALDAEARRAAEAKAAALAPSASNP